MKRYLLRTAGLLAVLLAAAPLFAGGKSEDFPEKQVDGKTHWTHSVNLSELEEGKYNILVRAVDEAGNARIEGPYDFVVDPETDIPSVSVAHPQPGARVGRILPIIGTARDDDGVARVLISVNEGPWREASGNESWSSVIDAAAMGDGPHTMAVKSVDLGGVESPPVLVPFVVDTSAPAGGVTDPVSGARVSGRTEFSGQMEDPNGIESMQYSRDGGETWVPLRFSLDKETGAAIFNIVMDARKMEDGPVVWWIRAEDMQGSISSVPFLFFVDNKGPEITLELPAAGEDGLLPVPGNVFLAGSAEDLSGVASLQILQGKEEPIDIPVKPGDPWWTWALNLSGRKEKKVSFTLRAVDGAGNVSVLPISIPLDAEADKPSLTVDGVETLAETPFSGGTARLTGVFSDDDGGGAVEWTAGEQTGRLENVDRSWRLDLKDVPAGPVNLQLIPEDRFGLKGDPVKLTFSMAPEPPLLSLDYFKDNMAAEAAVWKPGTVLSYSGGTIIGSVSSEMIREVKLSCIISGGEEFALPLKVDSEDVNRRIFNIVVKKGTESGGKMFTLRATDSFGGESVLGSGFFVQGPPDESGNVADPRKGSVPVTLATPSLRKKDGAVILRPGQPLQGWTSGASASGARLEPESPSLRLRSMGSGFLVESAAQGLSEPVKIVLSSGASTKPVRILTDMEAPQWEKVTPAPGSWSNGSVELKGTVVDNGGLKALSWALKGGASTPLEFEEKGKGRYVFQSVPDFAGQTDGLKKLVLKAEDVAGNKSEYEIPFMLDTRTPSAVMVLPAPNFSAGALNTLVFDVPGNEMIDEVSLTVDGETRTSARLGDLYALTLSLAGYDELPETLSVRFTDKAGNSSEITPALAYNPVADKPVTFIETPVADSVARGPSDIAGLVVDDDAIAAVYWRIDGADWEKLPGNALFRTPLPLDSLVDGAHLVEVYAEDAAGNVGEPDSAWFNVTRKEPEVTLVTPGVGVSLSGVTEITGTASDENGIASVWVSFDNGNSFFRAEGASDFGKGSGTEQAQGTESAEENPEAEEAGEGATRNVTAPLIRNEVVNWSYAMDTRILDDGVRVLLVKVVDGAGDEALLAGVLQPDNTKPLLNVSSPSEGSVHTGSMLVEGRVVDAGGIDKFRVRVERGGETLFEYKELTDGVFHIPFEFAGVEEGEALLLVEAEDSAGNVATISREFVIQPDRKAVVGEIVLPVEGASEGPFFSMAGFVDEALKTDKVFLVIDGEREIPLTLDRWGRFYREFVPGELREGEHVFRVDVVSGYGERSEGLLRKFRYRESGSWVLIDGYPPMMAVGARPLLEGRAGYYLKEPVVVEGEDEEENKASKAKYKEYENTVKANKPVKVEISLDGGLSFEKAKGGSRWKYRIETGAMREAVLPVLVRALFPEGWVYSRTVLRLDKTLPDLKLNESIADGGYNKELDLSGTADDNHKLGDISVKLRPGSRNRYETPAFVQGMFFDFQLMGATWVNAGLGVTFFDENVKLQVNAGWAPDMIYQWKDGARVPARVSGAAVGATLLANVVYLPLGYYWGPKWDRFSVSFALGANFTYFSKFTQKGGGMMSSVVAQVEVPKILFKDRKFLTYVAPFLDLRLWLFSSDVDTSPYFTGSVGVRVGLL